MAEAVILRPMLELPEVFPERTPGGAPEEVRALELRTRGRLLEGQTLQGLESRAQNLMYTLGGNFKEIDGALYQGTPHSAYYTETVAHEYAHCLHFNMETPKPLHDLTAQFRAHSVASNNENEWRTVASTWLTLDYLGLPYDPAAILWAMARNSKGRYWAMAEVYPILLELLYHPAAIAVARQICFRMLKIKYDQEARVLHVAPAASSGVPA